MSMKDELESGKKILAVVGLGYVGLPLAAEFSKHFHVIGFDVNAKKIQEYKAGHDATEELGDEALRASNIEFTCEPSRLRDASFIIIAVPTPVNADKTPDLRPVCGASETVGRQLSKGSVVVFESTVYPGVTEDICLPILEKESGLKGGRDFKIGYSPERINPGDKVHRLTNITKIVSGMDEEALKCISEVYASIIEAGVYEAPDIRVAEAAKLVENTQRDINIAFVNELAIVCHYMNISTNEVLKAMDTKWNALKFRPGLVGGHCIGIDPYYFIHQADILGYHPQLIASGRRVNNDMSHFVASAVIGEMVKAKLDVPRSRVFLMGMTFKENCPDVRNSLPVAVMDWLEKFGLETVPVDPVADAADFELLYHRKLASLDEVREADCLVVLVAHEVFRELGLSELRSRCRVKEGQRLLLMDVKSMFEQKEAESLGFTYWSL